MSGDSKKDRSLQEPQAGAPQQPEPRSTIPALVLFPTEERDRYEKFHKDLWDELAPEGVQQGMVTDRIIALSWRLQHLHVFREAQDARHKFRPFLRETLLETLAVYHDFNTKITHEKFEELRKRKTGSADDKTAEEQTTNLFDPCLMQEVLNSFKTYMEAAKDLLGPDAMKEVEEQRKHGLPIELAFLADVLTVENYLTELKLAAEIERAIDENRERLRKLKEEKRKSRELSKRGSRLLPPYD